MIDASATKRNHHPFSPRAGAKVLPRLADSDRAAGEGRTASRGRAARVGGTTGGFHGRCLAAGLFLGLSLFLGGCIRSRVIVTSDPVGADVTMNNEPRGKTPVEIPFAWYWYYNFELRKEGYEPVAVQERFRAPVYFWMPFDVVAEALPFPLYDTKRRHYVMVVRPPQEPVSGGASETRPVGSVAMP